MDLTKGKLYWGRGSAKCQRGFVERKTAVLLYIVLLIVNCNCQTVDIQSQDGSETKTDINNLGSNLEYNHCHSCESSNNEEKIDQSVLYDDSARNKNEPKERKPEGFMEQLIDTVDTFTKKYVIVNQTEKQLEHEFEKALDRALSKDRYEIIEGVEIKPIDTKRALKKFDKPEVEGRALFSTYTYEYRLYQKIKNFVETHILSINLPKAARLIGFRCNYFLHI